HHGGKTDQRAEAVHQPGLARQLVALVAQLQLEQQPVDPALLAERVERHDLEPAEPRGVEVAQCLAARGRVGSAVATAEGFVVERSEERRVGKECRCGGGPEYEKKEGNKMKV